MSLRIVLGESSIDGKGVLVRSAMGILVVEHVRGHHVRVAPRRSRDRTRDMSVYRFYRALVLGSFRTCVAA